MAAGSLGLEVGTTDGESDGIMDFTGCGDGEGATSSAQVDGKRPIAPSAVVNDGVSTSGDKRSA